MRIHAAPDPDPQPCFPYNTHKTLTNQHYPRILLSMVDLSICFCFISTYFLPFSVLPAPLRTPLHTVGNKILIIFNLMSRIGNQMIRIRKY